MIFDESLHGTCAFAGYLIRFRPRADVDPRFLFYFTKTQHFVDQVSIGSTEATISNFNAEKFSSLIVPAHSSTTQRAIADYLDRATARIDSVVSKKRRLIDLLEEQFLEATRSRVTGGMSFVDPLDVRDAEITRKDWARVKLGSDMKFGSGTTPTAGDERYYGDGIPWIITGNLRDRHVTDVARSVTPAALTEFPALRVHPSGALVVAMYGATVGRLGITAFPAAVNQACCVIHAGVRVDPEFLFYYLLTHRSVLIERSVGAGQPNISQEILRALRLPVPEIREQKRTVRELNKVRDLVHRLIERISIQLTLLTKHRRALVTAAVTGTRDPSSGPE